MTQQEIDQAIKDQIGTDPVAPLQATPDIATALANYVIQGANVSAVLNANLKAVYLTGFQNWANEVAAGKVPNTDPPKPPVAYISAMASDGWTYVIKGTDPVCPVPPIPPVSTVPSTWFKLDYVQNVPVGDTMPLGFVLTAPDGTKWQKQSSVTPFGVSFFYLRIG
jgi:hypothetical protein